jgi:hypothetical protein
MATSASCKIAKWNPLYRKAASQLLSGFIQHGTPHAIGRATSSQGRVVHGPGHFLFFAVSSILNKQHEAKSDRTRHLDLTIKNVEQFFFSTSRRSL